ncbi:hypothetical protein [Mycobacteroides abscessus]|uniref:hypothetical protein n=1 Tax=Mycobacteroides abscessus TaxID=36809 RepID=UPI000C26A664|nr:hypothetical protein [Mycobacteroides abscessus]
MSADLDALLDTIDQLESDTFSWADAAVWTPGVTVELADDPYDVLPMPDDGCVVVTDPERPWVVTDYTAPWWARD